jgi:cytochrome c biogenesis protein CcdA
MRNTAWDRESASQLGKCILSFLAGLALLFLALYMQFGDARQFLRDYPQVIVGLSAVFVTAGGTLLVCDFTTALKQLRTARAAPKKDESSDAKCGWDG